MQEKLRKVPGTLGWRFGLVVLALATFSLALGTQNAVDNNRNTQCLAAYARANAEVSAVRATATAEKDAAVTRVVDPLVAVLLDVTADPPREADPRELRDLRKGARAYKREVAELQARRAAHPLPAFPQQCTDANQ